MRNAPRAKRPPLSPHLKVLDAPIIAFPAALRSRARYGGRLRFASMVLLVGLVLPGANAGVSEGGTVVIAAEKHAFTPAEITVKVGTRVRWENRERHQYHSVFFEQLGDRPGDYFFPGESRERVFETPGSYPYICEPHWKSHGMKGVVHVEE